MPQIQQLRHNWLIFQQYTTLDDLRNALRLESSSPASPSILRSVCWKTLLFFETTETSTWSASLTAARAAYDALKARFTIPLESKELQDDPLAEGIERHWLALQDDENLRSEILQDVIRLPDDEYLRSESTQQTMLSILFVYCKLNPDLSYRQGMHELLAPILTIVEHDALRLEGDERDGLEPSDRLLASVFDSVHIEHDTFILFSRVMQNAKGFYEPTSHHAAENPLISRSNRITEELLKIADPQLARHLQRLAIPSQLYLMRWIRLLFGREFDRAKLPEMWDILFAEDPTLDLVDYVCVLMLLRVRWDLLEADYNGALALLLRYPSGQAEAKTLAIDALHLRDRLTDTTGHRLIVKYTGRSPVNSGRRSLTPPAMQRNITAVSGANALKSVFRGSPGESSSSQGQGDSLSSIEALLQNTARNILSKGEQLGIGKAVRTAVDDIHRRAQSVRDVDTLQPRLRSPRQRQPVQSRLTQLEERNTQLASLLEQSTECLWNVQKHLAENESALRDSPFTLDLEELSVAIGKVQFVQLHLQDSTLRLEARTSSSTSDANSQHDMGSKIGEPLNNNPLSSAHVGELPETASSPLSDEPRITTKIDGQQTDISSQSPPLGSSTSILTPQKNRPLLAESSYSWMLGQEQKQPQARTERPDTLFGT